MEIHKSANEYGNSVFDALKKNWKVLIMLILFTVGMVLGAVIIKNNNNAVISAFTDIFKTYITARKSQSIMANFLNSLSVNSIFLLSAFVLGLCAVGIPLISVLPVIKGLGMGMLSGYMYSKFALSGLGYCVLIIYPGLIMSAFALLLSCSTAVSTSYEMLLSLSSNKTIKGEGSLKFYCTKFVLIAAITILSSVLDAVVLRLFSGMFSF